MLYSFTRSTIAGVAAILAIGATSLPASARTVVAFAGRAENRNDAWCFSSEGYGTMTNLCGTTKTFVVPLPVDAAGNYAVTVTGEGATPSNNVCCDAIGISRDGLSVFGGPGPFPFQCMSTFAAPANIGPLNRFVPWGGGLYAYCLVDPNARVRMVNW